MLVLRAYMQVLTRLQHVEQLLRTLNLNSPAPPDFPAVTIDGGLMPSSASPSISPISTTSELHTPPNHSPAKPFGDWKMNPSHEYAPVYQTQPHNALHFDADQGLRYYEVPGASQTSLFRPAQSTDSLHIPAKAFSCNSSPVEGMMGDAFAHMDYPTAPRRDSVPNNLFASSWSPQRLRSSSAEWIKPDERRMAEHAGFVAASDPPRNGSSHASAHEVRGTIPCGGP